MYYQNIITPGTCTLLTGKLLKYNIQKYNKKTENVTKMINNKGKKKNKKN